MAALEPYHPRFSTPERLLSQIYKEGNWLAEHQLISSLTPKDHTMLKIVSALTQHYEMLGTDCVKDNGLMLKRMPVVLEHNLLFTAMWTHEKEDESVGTQKMDRLFTLYYRIIETFYTVYPIPIDSRHMRLLNSFDNRKVKLFNSDERLKGAEERYKQELATLKKHVEFFNGSSRP